MKTLNEKHSPLPLKITDSELKSFIHVMDSVQDHCEHLDRDSLYKKDVKNVKKLISKIKRAKGSV